MSRHFYTRNKLVPITCIGATMGIQVIMSNIVKIGINLSKTAS